jgi:hypothetical protein
VALACAAWAALSSATVRPENQAAGFSLVQAIAWVKAVANAFMAPVRPVVDTALCPQRERFKVSGVCCH